MKFRELFVDIATSPSESVQLYEVSIQCDMAYVAVGFVPSNISQFRRLRLYLAWAMQPVDAMRVRHEVS